MMRYFSPQIILFVLALLQCCDSSPLRAQSPRYELELQLHPHKGEYTLQGTIEITTPHPDSLQFIPMEFWPYALSSENSSLQREMLEDQKTKLHFASGDERGSHYLVHSQGGNILTSSFSAKDPDVYTLTARSDHSGTVRIHISVAGKLPEGRFNGYGMHENGIFLKNWFPRYSPRPVAAGREEDRHFLPADYKLEVKLPANWLLVSNAPAPAAEKGQINGNIPAQQGEKIRQFTLDKASDIRLFAFRELEFMALKDENTDARDIYIHYEYGLKDQLSGLTGGMSRILKYYEENLGWKFGGEQNILLMNESLSGSTEGLYTIRPGGLFSLKQTRDPVYAERALAEAVAYGMISSHYEVNGAENPWLTKGMAVFLAYEYMRKHNPDENMLGRFGNHWIAQFFDLDDIPLHQRLHLLYLLMARQGLDQPAGEPSHCYSSLNYEAVVKGKVPLGFFHLKDYMGKRHFVPAMHAYFADSNRILGEAKLSRILEEKSGQSQQWFFEELIHSDKRIDYSLQKTDYCPTVFTADVKNRGEAGIPFKLTGYKGDSAFIDIWYQGHKGKKTVQFYHDEFDRLEIDHEQRMPESKKTNNPRYRRWFPKRRFPGFQLYTSLEDPRKRHIYFLPTLGYNAYDKFLPGISFYNSTVIPKAFEYRFGPDYSIGTGKLTGYTSLNWNQLPTSGPFHRIRYGLYGRYYHYDRDLAFLRLSPAVNFSFRKSSPRSEIMEFLKARMVFVEREVPPDLEGSPNELTNASYRIFNLSYTRENVNILRPTEWTVDFQISDRFSRIHTEYDHRWLLPNKKWLYLRGFAGAFLFNNTPAENAFYNFGLSATRDYLFDFLLFGRSDETGIWSQQFFISDGGFKSKTDHYSPSWMLTVNTQIPLWQVFGLFADAGIYDSFDRLYWDYGFRLALVQDFVELYFPIQSFERNFVLEQNYLSNTRFILSLDLDDIVHRLRRGRY